MKQSLLWIAVKIDVAMIVKWLALATALLVVHSR